MSALSPDDRALIDAALAAGRVTRVPRGTSGIPLPVWDAQANALRYPDGAAQLLKTNASMWKGLRRGGGAPDPAVTARRARVRELHAEGQGGTQIARALGVKPTTIWNDLHVLGLSSNRTQQTLAAERHAKIAELASAATGAAEIAAAVGLTPERVYRVALAQRLPLARPGTSRRDSARQDIDAKVQALVAEGLAKGEIRARLDLSSERLRMSLRRLGLDAPKVVSRGDARVEADAARVARVREMAAQGVTRGVIAAEVGILSRQVVIIGRRHGFEVLPDPRAPRRACAVSPGRPKGRPRPAESTRQRVADLQAQGLTLARIAEALGLASKSTVAYHLKMLGKTAPRPRDPRAAQRVAELARAKATPRMIADVCAMPVARVRMILRDLAAADGAAP